MTYDQDRQTYRQTELRHCTALCIESTRCRQSGAMRTHTHTHVKAKAMSKFKLKVYYKLEMEKCQYFAMDFNSISMWVLMRFSFCFNEIQFSHNCFHRPVTRSNPPNCVSHIQLHDDFALSSMQMQTWWIWLVDLVRVQNVIEYSICIDKIYLYHISIMDDNTRWTMFAMFRFKLCTVWNASKAIRSGKLLFKYTYKCACFMHFVHTTYKSRLT